ALPRPRRMPPLAGPRSSTSKVAATAVLILVSVCFLAPLSWLVLAAFDPGAGAGTQVPDDPTLDNFASILTVDLGLRPLLNSLALSMLAAVTTVVAAVLAAYPLSRYQMRFNRPFMYTVL